jgi:hypothetical protein
LVQLHVMQKRSQNAATYLASTLADSTSLLVGVCLALLVFESASAQTSIPTSKGFLYNTEKVTDIRLHTNRGYGLFYQKGKIITYYKTTFYQIGISELKLPKEYKQGSDPSLSRQFRPYVYGKQNNVFAVRGGYGTKRYFSEKAKRRGVAVGMSYTLGASLAVIKPYYMALRRNTPDQPGVSRVVSEKYSEENASVFLDESKIIGASSFFKGFDELSLSPGGSTSIALHLDWGAFDEMLKAMEVGIMIDFYPRTLPILVTEENQKLFLNFYVSMQLGRRR